MDTNSIDDVRYMRLALVEAQQALAVGEVPIGCVIVADNQIVTTEYAASLGVVKNLGWHEQVTVETYKTLLMNLTIEGMSEKGLQLTANKQPNAWLHEILELKA